jgi:hypothetical protein
VDLDENPMIEVLEKDKKKTLVIGSIVASSILIPFLLVTKTNLLHPTPIECWKFPSKEDQKVHKICLVAIDSPYNPSNGDVSLVLSVDRGDGKDTVVNTDFWIADDIGNKKVNYRGEFSVNRSRVYRNNILARDDKTQWSSWVKPSVPNDLVIPLWDKIKSKEGDFTYSRRLIEDQIMEIIEGIGALLAAIGSIIFTLWKFFSE